MPAAKRHLRRQGKKTQRREQILAAAFAEFAINGYAATRLDDVARRARIAKGTVFLHFKNKKLLFRSVVRNMIHPVLGDIDTFVASFPGSNAELLSELLSRPYSEVVKNEKAREIIRLLIGEARKFPQLSEIYHREIIQPGMTAIRLVLEKGIAAGEFRRTATVDFPQILVAPMVLAVVWTLIHGEQQPLDLDSYMAAHLDLLLDALRQAGEPLEAGKTEATAPRGMQ